MKKVTAEEFEAMLSIDNLECFTVEQVNSHLLAVNSEMSKSIDEELKEKRLKEIQSLQPIEVHDWDEQTASIVKSIFYVRENQLRSVEEEDQIHKSYADTELNRELNRVGKHVYSEEIEKAQGNKYFKREGTPGNYKYYYTEAEYKAGKSNKYSKDDIRYKQEQAEIGRKNAEKEYALPGSQADKEAKESESEDTDKKTSDIHEHDGKSYKEKDLKFVKEVASDYGITITDKEAKKCIDVCGDDYYEIKAYFTE